MVWQSGVLLPTLMRWCSYIVGVCRDYITAAPTTPALDVSSMGVLRDHDDSDEAAMLAALDAYEAKAGKGVKMLS